MSSAEQVIDAVPEHPEGQLSTHPEGTQSYAWWGMAWLIATEATLFAALIASYFYLRFRHGPTWPPAGIPEPELGLPLIMTVILLSSSAPVHWADLAIRRGRQARLRV
ncbi:MAG: cytochrome c oxidase subunit 3, partial [Actinomycetota bacterium]|nr:cytochrome c oxidase subunit 3 [Actinomycetota bacterium]